MGIFSQIKSAVNSILPSLFNDEDLAVSVTWKVFSSSIFDESEGVNISTYNDYIIKAIRITKEVEGYYRSKASQYGSIGVNVGDLGYLFRHDDMPAGAGTRDLLIEGEQQYSIVRIEPVFGLIVKVEVKGYA